MEGMTTTYLWIAIAVIVLILLAIVLVVLGKKRGESKKVSFDKPVEEPKELTQQQKSGNYQAKSGFNFAPAGGSPRSSLPRSSRLRLSPPRRLRRSRTRTEISAMPPSSSTRS